MVAFQPRSHYRYAVRMPVKLERGARAKASGLLIELSQDAARISQLGRGKYAEGDKVVILTSCERQLAGTIRWARDGLAGVRLDRPLRQVEIDDLLERARGRAEQGELLVA